MATILGTTGADVLIGTSDNDLVIGDQGNDTILAGEGADTITFDDDSGHDSVDAGTGGDLLGDGYTYNDYAGLDGDILYGGALTQDATVVFGADDRGGSVAWEDGGIEFTGVEQVVTGSGNDTLDARAVGYGVGRYGVGMHGDSGDDVLYGSDFRDTLDGGTGNDVIHGGDGDDLIQSGPGDDTVYGGGGDDGIRWGKDWDGPTGHEVYYGGETDEISGDALNMWGAVDHTITLTSAESGHVVDPDGNTLEFHEFERLMTAEGNDHVDGSMAAIVDGIGFSIQTKEGDDTIIGSDGNDFIDAGYGADLIDAGRGNDVIIVNANLYGDPSQPDLAEDVVMMRDGGGRDTIVGMLAPTDNGDGTYGAIDRIDVSDLHDADGNPVDIGDVVVSADVWGNAVLTFPNGEAITLNGVSPADVSSAAQLNALGIPCFTRGTLIQCPEGQRRVEDLRVGDMVQTCDHGDRAIRWIGSRRLSASELALVPNLRPVRIARGALGPDIPAADLIVSPQHRILVRSAIAMRMFCASEVLVAACQLLSLDGVDLAVPGDIEYFHILFDQHEIVLSNGARTESLYTGAQALESVGPAARREILTLFPELRAGAVPPSARPLIPGRKARRLVERHARNGRPLLDGRL